MSKIKVCCFCDTWESGGIESFLNNVYHNLDLSVFDVNMVVTKQSESVFTEPLKQLGINFYELSSNQNDFIKNTKKLKEILKKGNYDVAHLNIFHGASLIYAKVARSAGVPKVIVHSHNTALRKSRTKALKMCIHKLAGLLFSKYATEFWACSRIAAEFMFPKRILEKRGYVFIPNGIFTEKFVFNSDYRDKKRKELGIDDSFVIGCVGRLTEQKNQIFLIDVLKKALEQRECRLLLVGEGIEEDAVREKADKLGVSDKVIFYGVSTEVNLLMCCMDCLAMPSTFEGLGIVAIEAQCLGVPVVCSENVPQEAHVSDCIKSINLDKGPEEWAEVLLKTEKSGNDSAKHLSSVRNAGFDIKNVSELIGNKYSEGTIING